MRYIMELNSNEKERFANRIMDFVDAYLFCTSEMKIALPLEFPQACEAPRGSTNFTKGN